MLAPVTSQVEKGRSLSQKEPVVKAPNVDSGDQAEVAVCIFHDRSPARWCCDARLPAFGTGVLRLYLGTVVRGRMFGSYGLDLGMLVSH